MSAYFLKHHHFLFQKKLTKDASHFDKKIIEKLPFGEIPWKNRYFSSPLATEKLC
nr:hypothetical protein 1BD1_00035 [Acinetobacter sp. TTH0-4]